jgi:hypothetical protein
MKGVRIIHSCETLQQMRIANNWVYLFGKLTKFSYLWNKLDIFYGDKLNAMVDSLEYSERLQIMED